MPRKKTLPALGTGAVGPEMSIDVLDDLRPMNNYGAKLSAEAQRTMAALWGGNSLRPDLAGTTWTQLQIPMTYQQKVTKMWEAYATDPLFMRLINRVVDFAAAGFRWEHQEDPGSLENQREPWPTKIKRWKTDRKESVLEKEEGMWEAWSKEVNRDTPNALQGLDFVVRWAVRHCLLGGMFVGHWQWQVFEYGKQQFLFPMAFTCYPTSQIVLDRPVGQFQDEEIYLRMPQSGTRMQDNAMGFEATTTGMPGQAGSNMVHLKRMGVTQPVPGWTEAFALKYEWSPGDMTTTRIGNYQATGWGLYPMPPFQALMPQFALRQKLFASDDALADGVAQYVKVFKVGSEKFQPKMGRKDAQGNWIEKSTMEEVREVLEPYLSSSALAIYLPWYVDMDYKMPNTETLMNEEKYIPSSIEILQSFGFLFPRSSAGRNEDLNWVNVAGFEEMLKTVQRHVGGFMRRFVHSIVAANNGKIKYEPTWTPFPPNTQTAEARKQILELAAIGRVSSQTLLEAYNLSVDLEKRRIAKDAATEADEMFDDNVPMNNKQAVIMPSGQPNKTVKNTNPKTTPSKTTAPLPPAGAGPGPDAPAVPKSASRKKPRA